MMKIRNVYSLHGTMDYARRSNVNLPPKRCAQIDDHPAVIDFCVNCSERACKRGDCESLQALKKQLKSEYKIYTKQKSSRLIIEYNGELLSLSQLAERHNLPYQTLYDRVYKMKMPIYRALVLPFKRRNSND